MSVTQDQHPLSKCSEQEQVAYLSILSALCYVDQDFSDKERQQLDTLITQLGISNEGRSKIYSAIFSLQDDQKIDSLVLLESLNNTEIKFTLISDMCLLAYSDSEFTNQEYQYILEIADVLNITEDQVNAIRSVQENIKVLDGIPSDSEQAKSLLKEGASKLASAGVPIAAIAASGSVFGLSAAGMTSGLAALGAVVGGGMLAGTVLVVPAIALGSAYGVKKAFDFFWKDKSKAKK